MSSQRFETVCGIRDRGGAEGTEDKPDGRVGGAYGGRVSSGGFKG